MGIVLGIDASIERTLYRRSEPGFAHRVPDLTQDMLAYVKRTTVKIPDDLDAALRHEAQRLGLTISEVTLRALEAYLYGGGGRRTLGAAAAGRSGREDVSERIEEILSRELSA